jgi:hypothetical protein
VRLPALDFGYSRHYGFLLNFRRLPLFLYVRNCFAVCSGIFVPFISAPFHPFGGGHETPHRARISLVHPPCLVLASRISCSVIFRIKFPDGW